MFDFDPDPELDLDLVSPEKSDPDPEKIFPYKTHRQAEEKFIAHVKSLTHH